MTTIITALEKQVHFLSLAVIPHNCKNWTSPLYLFRPYKCAILKILYLNTNQTSSAQKLIFKLVYYSRTQTITRSRLFVSVSTTHTDMSCKIHVAE